MMYLKVLKLLILVTLNICLAKKNAGNVGEGTSSDHDPLALFPGLSTLSDEVSSGPLTHQPTHPTNTISAENFSYDGRERKVYLRVGDDTPSNITRNISDILGENYGEKVTLSLPNAILDTITTPPRANIRILPEFSRLAHGLRSGNITILDERTILIPKLHYDGRGPDAHFWVGIGPEPTANGKLVPYNGSQEILPAFNGENVTITLPEDLTIDDIEWLAVWCIQYKHNFGFVRLHLETTPDYITLPPFSQLAHGLRSGPILIIDDRTFFITNLHYDGRGPDAHFWVGNGTNGPDPQGYLIPDENNSNGTLAKYQGQDIYIRLPPHLNVHMIDYFGMWCIQYKHNFGYTDIPKGLKKLSVIRERPEFNEDGEYIARLPKCCPLGTVKTVQGCIPSRLRLDYPIEMYMGNSTMLDDEPMNITFDPYVYKPSCDYGMYLLDSRTDNYYLLSSGFLLLADGEILNKDRFCVDSFSLESDVEETNVLVQAPLICFPEEKPPEFLNKIYAGCIYISAIFLAFTSAIFIFVKSARNIRGFNVLGYSIFMSLSFFCLATAKLFHVTGTACTVIGSIYQFLLVSTFTWLFCLTYETYHRVSRYNTNHYKNRFYIYGGMSLLAPILAVIASIIGNNFVPSRFNKPNSSLHDPCWFRSDKKVIFYYVPILMSILLNGVFAVKTWIKIKIADEEQKVTWKVGDININLKNVSNYLLLIVMTICWVAEVLSHFFETRNGIWIAIDVIDSLQGLFVFIIFILHNPVIEILKVKWAQHFQKDKEDLFITQSKPLCATFQTPPCHMDALTTIHHAESVENLCVD